MLQRNVCRVIQQRCAGSVEKEEYSLRTSIDRELLETSPELMRFGMENENLAPVPLKKTVIHVRLARMANAITQLYNTNIENTDL